MPLKGNYMKTIVHIVPVLTGTNLIQQISQTNGHVRLLELKVCDISVDKIINFSMVYLPPVLE